MAILLPVRVPHTRQFTLMYLDQLISSRLAPHISIVIVTFALGACQNRDHSEASETTKPVNAPLFEEINSQVSGISFANTVVQNGGENVLNYPYYFNGGGVAIGDINNDGLQDVFFTGNQVPNKLFLNKGNFKFEDISDKAGVSAPLGWRTGVTMTDFNGDGFLDIYVCRSAMTDSTLRKNQLFINNGNLTFTTQVTPREETILIIQC